jgi:hypothetical protein
VTLVEQPRNENTNDQADEGSISLPPKFEEASVGVGREIMLGERSQAVELRAVGFKKTKISAR